MNYWVLQNHFPLKTHFIEGDWLVYHEGNGQTHRLSGITGLVFQIILNSDKPLTALEVDKELHKLAIDEIDQLSYNVEQTLSALSAAYLLQNC